MDEWQTVHQYCDIIAILVRSAFFHILIGNLKAIVVDVLLVDEFYVLRQTVIEFQGEDVAFALQHFGLVLNSHLLVRNHRKQSGPFAIGKTDIVQAFQLFAKIAKQSFFVMDDVIDVALSHQLIDEGVLQLCFALIGSIGLWLNVIMRHDGLMLLLNYNLVVVHNPIF